MQTLIALIPLWFVLPTLIAMVEWELRGKQKHAEEYFKRLRR